MPLVPNFTATQILGEPSEIFLTDTSTGSNVAITQRRVYIRMANGIFIVPEGTSTEYIEWNYLDTTITINALLKDVAVTVIVEWLDVSNAVLYDKYRNYGFTLYNRTFDYTLTQRLTGNPLLINDNNFWANKSSLVEKIDSGDNAIEFASDLFGAQQCYDAATEIRLNAANIFNANS